MVREKAKGATTLQSWNEADDALREIGDVSRVIAKREAEATEKIENIKARLQMETAEHNARKTALVHDLEAFALLHRDEIKEETGGNKSIELAHGKLGFRKSTKLTVKKVAAVIAMLKARKLLKFIRTTETVNKEAMRDLSDDELRKFGVSREIEDTFWCEPNETTAKGISQ